jgi:hypothetical protein
MRLYYIFSIKDDILKITKNNPERLYVLLKSIYSLDKENSKLGYKVFQKTCNFFDKKNINLHIKELNSDNYSYICFRDSHIINDFYNNESTRLTVNYSHLVLKTNILYPRFLSEIRNLKNLFICDFTNEDYFYLKDISSEKIIYS